MKRIKTTSIVLALLMIISAAFTLPASAETTETSGSIGANITWSYDKDKSTITVSGTGDMKPDKTKVTANDYPWYSFASGIKNIVIESGVTSLSDSAFASCYNLETISLPSTIRLELDKNSLMNPKKEIILDESNPYLTLDSGILYDKDKTVVFSCPREKTAGYIEIPETVGAVYRTAFYECTNIEKLYFKNTNKITVYSDNSFYNWSYYQTVYFACAKESVDWSEKGGYPLAVRCVYNYKADTPVSNLSMSPNGSSYSYYDYDSKREAFVFNKDILESKKVYSALSMDRFDDTSESANDNIVKYYSTDENVFFIESVVQNVPYLRINFPGEAYIIAKNSAGKELVRAKIIVQESVWGVTLSNRNISGEKGAQIALRYTLENNENDDNIINFSIDNSKVAKIDSVDEINKRIYIKYLKAGVCNLLLKNSCEEEIDSAKITVTQPVTSIKTNKSSVKLNKGKETVVNAIQFSITQDYMNTGTAKC